MTTGVVTVVLAADDGYARPLTVAARSVAATLAPGSRLQLCVLDMGIEEANRSAIEATFAPLDVELVWVDQLRDRVAHLPNTWALITRATYARLYIPEVLPASVERAIYLDCDVLARRDLGELFTADMGGCSAMAVPDFLSPFVGSVSGVPLWFAAGRSADELNFNAGVVLMDLSAWRRDATTEACLAYLTDGRHHFAQDQEALNVVLAGRIGALDPRWNQQSEIFDPRYAVTLPYDRELVDQLRADPYIVHYSSEGKPWQHGDDHPRVGEWFDQLDETAYAGWRPPGPTRAQALATRGRDLAKAAARRLDLLPGA